MPDAPPLSIYKNNSDGKGNSYGTHENYLVDRATPFADIVRDLTPFFVTRQVFCGAGKVGSRRRGTSAGRPIYQLTQRADFFETEVGLETTLKRPIINTRDEPHADPEKYRRLHVIIGDANMCEVATFLKIGTTAIVLKMIEDRFLPDLSLENPVRRCTPSLATSRARSRCDSPTAGASRAVQLQWEYFEHAKKYVEREDDTPENHEVLERWEGVLDRTRDRAALAASRAGLGGEVPAAGGVPRAGRARPERPEAPGDRPPVPRRPAREGPVLPARALGQGGAPRRPTRRSSAR